MYERYLDVYRAVDYFEEVMGTAWLKESLELLKSTSGGGGSFGRGIDLSSCAVSAAAYYWYRAREELALAGIGGQGPGFYALQAAVLGDDLMALRGSEGLSSRVEGLKSPADAGDVIAELVIASGFARSGRPVVFINDGRAFYVLKPEAYMLLVHHHRCQGNGNGVKEKMECSTVGISKHQQETVFSVVYRYIQNGGLSLEANQSDADPAGAPVVDCSFVARQGRRGPEMVRTGRLTGGSQYPSEFIHIPNEIIMPALDQCSDTKVFL